jgi:hypothetical protein
MPAAERERAEAMHEEKLRAVERIYKQKHRQKLNRSRDTTVPQPSSPISAQPNQ